MIRILWFAWLRETIGTGEELIPLPHGVRTLDDLLRHLETRSEAGRMALSERERLRFAINQDYAMREATVRDGDEIAIFPPVTGG